MFGRRLLLDTSLVTKALLGLFNRYITCDVDVNCTFLGYMSGKFGLGAGFRMEAVVESRHLCLRKFANKPSPPFRYIIDYLASQRCLVRGKISRMDRSNGLSDQTTVSNVSTKFVWAGASPEQNVIFPNSR
jgi:hypothetical protein